MAEYWVGPSLRGGKRWEKSSLPAITGKHHPDAIRRAQPIVPRRYRAMARLAENKLQDVNFLVRYVAHLSLMVLVLVTGKLYSADITEFLSSLSPKPVTAAVEPAALPLRGGRTASTQESAFLTWSALPELPEVSIQERPAAARIDPITYEVREGENPTLIADRFGLQPSTIVWSNADTANNGLLQTGQKLVIPPVDGILHTVKSGDTLAAISEKYTADLNTVIAFEGNHITDANAPLVIGQYVMVPGGTYPYEAPPAPPPARAATNSNSGSRSTAAAAPATPIYGSGCCIWPVSGRITQGSSNWHTALDIATAMGTPIVAADGGRVVAAGWDNTGYGWRVIIDHGNGVRTLYAHMSSYIVNYGDYVNKGAMIGRIGSTGQSTGPHLHFEVRVNNYRQNPWNWLR